MSDNELIEAELEASDTFQINYTFAKELPSKNTGTLPNSARRPKKSILKSRTRKSNGNVDFKFNTDSKKTGVKGESKTTKNITKFDFWDIEALKIKAKSQKRRETKQKKAWLESD